MRVLFDVSYIQRNRAGIGRHALQLVKALLHVDEKNEYILHGWSFGIDRESLFALAKPQVTFSVARIPGAIKRWYWNRLRFPAIETFIGKVDLVHSTDPFLPRTRARTICTVHDLAYKKFPELFEPRVPKWDCHVQRSVRSATAIIVPSYQTQFDLIELFDIEEKRIHVVQPPVGEMFVPEKNPNVDEEVRTKFCLTKPYLLFVGTLEPRKNIPTLIRAFGRTRDESHCDVELVLVGKRGWKEKEIFETMKSSPLQSRIKYLAYVTDTELASLYRQALCFVYPSLYEGYGFPVLEAMACGVPVVTSMNSAMRELADGVAVLTNPTSVEDLAEAMAALITNEVRRVELRHRGLQAVRQFTPESAAKRILAIYDALRS